MSTLSPVPLFCDITSQTKSGLKQSFASQVQAGMPYVFRNDGDNLSLRFMVPSVTTYRVYDDYNPSADTVQVSVGLPDQLPTAGTFTATWGANTTTALAFNCSATQFATALNALASIISAGGVTVVNTPLGFIVTWNNDGSRALITINASLLTPQCVGIVFETTAGSGSEQEVQQINIIQMPVAYLDSTDMTAFPVAAATVTIVQVGGSGKNTVQSILLSPAPYDGTFIIATAGGNTAPIPYGATAAQVATALNAVTANRWTVTGSPGLWFVTETSGTSIAAMTVNVSGLTVPVGLTGTLKFNSSILYQLFSLTTSTILNLLFEIKITNPGALPQVVLQVPCSVFKDVLQGGNIALAIVPTAYTKAESDATFVAKANNGSDFTNLPTTLANLWKSITTTAGAFLYMGAASTLSVLAPNATGTVKFLQMVSSVPSWTTIAASLPPWLIKTSTYTAVAGDRIQADTATTGTFTITLPATATIGDVIQIEDANYNWGTANLTIAPNGLKINGGTSNYIASVSGNKLSLVYISLGYGWSIK